MPARVQHLVVDTNAFINCPDLRAIGENVYTVQEVIDEVKCKRQLRHLAVLPFELVVKDACPESVRFVTEFSKKSGDYASLSAVDLKVVALAHQLHKEKLGNETLRETPVAQRAELLVPNKDGCFEPISMDHNTVEEQSVENSIEDDEEQLDQLRNAIETLRVENEPQNADLLMPVAKNEHTDSGHEGENSSENDSFTDEEDEGDWITVDNIERVKKNIDDQFLSDETAVVSCITADFAMQNVLKQIGLNVSSYDGKLIKRVRTFILRCITCFKTTSVMTKQFCANCGHASLKKVSVTLDENGKQYIFINTKRPLTSRGKRFSLPAPRGGHHAQNPVLNADQALSRVRPSKLARKKNNPLDPDYVAGFSPFVMRDVNSKSAVLGIRNQTEIKNWMRKNPNEVRRKRK